MNSLEASSSRLLSNIYAQTKPVSRGHELDAETIKEALHSTFSLSEALALKIATLVANQQVTRVRELPITHMRCDPRNKVAYFGLGRNISHEEPYKKFVEFMMTISWEGDKIIKTEVKRLAFPGDGARQIHK